MNFPELAIFPADSVAITLTTTVWIGVLVVTFFNLRCFASQCRWV